MIELWGRTSSFNVQKVTWTLAELGLAFQRHDVGGAFGGLNNDDYGVMNPNRRIPVLKDGSTVVWESNAVVRYLAARYGAGSLWSEDPAKRSEADRWMDWQAVTLQRWLHPIFWGMIRTAKAERNQTEINEAVCEIQPLWRLLDRHLENRSYVAGAALSMGDIPLGCAYWRYLNIDVERPPLPSCDRWYQELKCTQPYRDHVMLEVV